MNILRKHIGVVLFIWMNITSIIATADISHIQEQLAEAKWISIMTNDYVMFERVAWEGRDDLSLAYSFRIVDGSLYIAIKVTDDQVLLKDSQTILSDHVEIWLADPRLIDFSQDSITSLQDIAHMEEVIEERTGYWRDLANTTLEKYRARYFCTQIIFNKTSVFFALGNEEYQVNTISDYHYVVTDTGYEFYGQIPLAHTFDVKNSQIHEIAYLIDVVDIDNSDAQYQELLMSSSHKRRFGMPSTFNRLRLPVSYTLPLPIQTEAFTQLAPKGFLAVDFSQMQYQYTVESWGVGDCLNFFEVPNYYRIFSPDSLYTDIETGIIIVVYEQQIAFIHNGQITIIEIPVNEGFVQLSDVLYFQKKADHYYTLIPLNVMYGAPCSRGPCAGANFEALAWLKLDRNFHMMESEKLLLSDSCGWLSEGIPRIEDKEPFKKSQLETFSGFRATISEYTVLFNEHFPEHGIIDTLFGWSYE